VLRSLPPSIVFIDRSSTGARFNFGPPVGRGNPRWPWKSWRPRSLCSPPKYTKLEVLFYIKQSQPLFAGAGLGCRSRLHWCAR
jgi:hypothetical protein